MILLLNAERNLGPHNGRAASHILVKRRGLHEEYRESVSPDAYGGGAREANEADRRRGGATDCCDGAGETKGGDSMSVFVYMVGAITCAAAVPAAMFWVIGRLERPRRK